MSWLAWFFLVVALVNGGLLFIVLVAYHEQQHELDRVEPCPVLDLPRRGVTS